MKKVLATFLALSVVTSCALAGTKAKYALKFDDTAGSVMTVELLNIPAVQGYTIDRIPQLYVKYNTPTGIKSTTWSDAEYYPGQGAGCFNVKFKRSAFEKIASAGNELKGVLDIIAFEVTYKDVWGKEARYAFSDANSYIDLGKHTLSLSNNSISPKKISIDLSQMVMGDLVTVKDYQAKQTAAAQK